jgi:hypothetical protein
VRKELDKCCQRHQHDEACRLDADALGGEQGDGRDAQGEDRDRVRSRVAGAMRAAPLCVGLVLPLPPCTHLTAGERLRRRQRAFGLRRRLWGLEERGRAGFQ